MAPVGALAIVTTGSTVDFCPTKRSRNTSVLMVVNGLAAENGAKSPSSFGSPITSRPAKADQGLSTMSMGQKTAISPSGQSQPFQPMYFITKKRT